MPTAKEISKTIGKILIGSIMAGVVGGAINYALTPDEEKNINKSIQFGVMTFGALLMSQITHLVYNQMVQEHAVSAENWNLAIDEHDLKKQFKLLGIHAGELFSKTFLTLAGAEAGKSAYFKPGQNLEGLKEDASSFPIVLSISVTAAILSQTLLKPSIPDSAKKFITTAIETLAIFIAGIPFAYRSGKPYLENMPLLMPFAAAGIVSTIISIGFEEIKSRRNANSAEAQPLLSTDTEEGIQDNPDNEIVPRSALTVQSILQPVKEEIYQEHANTSPII